MDHVVTAEQVERHFVRSARTRGLVGRWIERHGNDEVVRAVREHRSRVVNSVTVEEVERVCRSTEHALAEVSKKSIEGVRSVRDWTCPFAVSHVFHFITEAVGTVPTYQQFRRASGSPGFRHMLWTPAAEAIQACIRDGVPKNVACDAMRWRVGNFYYSFLREQWVHAYLRSHGVTTRQHPLADALFAADGWVDDKVISLYIGNATYRTADGGRKRRPEDLLRGSRPAFRFVTMELPAVSSYGVVHLPPRDELDVWIRRHFHPDTAAP